MNQAIFAAVVCLAGIAVGVRLWPAWKRASRAALELAPDEVLHFELDGLTVHSHSTNNSGHSMIVNAVVRVTSRRVVVAQRPLLSGPLQIRYVLTRSGSEPIVSPGLRAILATGFISSELDPKRVEFDAERGLLLVPACGTTMFTRTVLKIPVSDLAPWREAGLLTDVRCS